MTPREYIDKLLVSIHETTEKAATKPKLEAALQWLRSLREEITSEQITEAVTFLEGLEKLELPINEEKIEEMQSHAMKLFDSMKDIKVKYEDAVSTDSLQGCELLKVRCNEIRQELTMVYFEIEGAYRRLDRYVTKVYLNKKANDICDRNGVSHPVAKETVKTFPEYVKLEQLKERLFILRGTSEQIFKNMDALHTDIRQTVSVLRKALPDM